jgi:hypothetical protein
MVGDQTRKIADPRLQIGVVGDELVRCQRPRRGARSVLGGLHHCRTYFIVLLEPDITGNQT